MSLSPRQAAALALVVVAVGALLASWYYLTGQRRDAAANAVVAEADSFVAPDGWTLIERTYPRPSSPIWQNDEAQATLTYAVHGPGAELCAEAEAALAEGFPSAEIVRSDLRGEHRLCRFRTAGDLPNISGAVVDVFRASTDPNTSSATATAEIKVVFVETR